MHARQEVPAAVSRLAHYQDGVVTRAQVTGNGVSADVIKRLVDSGRWQRISPGVYHVVGGPVGWASLAWAGVLLGGPAARLGPAGSAHVSGLLPVAPDPIDVLVPAGRSTQRDDRWRFIREKAGIRGRSTGSPPRLPAEDFVLDLTATADPDAVIGLVTEAFRLQLVTPRRLRRALDRRRRHPQRRTLELLLADGDGIESPLELEYLRAVERGHQLPRGVRQQVSARWRYRRDVEYSQFGVLVELDGRQGHRGDGAFRDMTRDNVSALTGRRTARFGWRHVFGNPCGTAVVVHQLIGYGGYREPLGRCSRCASVPDHQLLDLVA